MRSEANEQRGTLRVRSVAECVERGEHAGRLDGAFRVGEARADGRVVRIGVWDRASPLRARYLATTCASLIAYAEVACEALEAGVPPASLDARALRARLRGVHPFHLERAALVAAAIRAAFSEERP